MIAGNISAALTPNLPSSDAEALSLYLTHSSKPFLSLGGGLPAVPSVPPPPGIN